MYRIIYIALIALAAQAGIVTSATCATTTGSVTNTHYCQLNDMWSQTEAYADVTAQIVLGVFEVRLSNYAYGVSDPVRPVTAFSGTEFSGALSTTGPRRPGWLEYTIEVDESSSWIGSSTYATLGGFNFHCVEGDGPNIHCAPYGYQPSGFVGVTLGEWTNIDISQTYGGLITGGRVGSRRGEGILRLRFLELDQTTPVAFTVVPEPSALLLIGPALAALVWGCRRRR